MVKFKVIYQKNLQQERLNERIHIKKYLVGKQLNSFAIHYTPAEYKKWLQDDKVFNAFIELDIIQPVITNQKFEKILDVQKKLNLSVVDCEFYNISVDEVESLIDYETINQESLKYFLSKYEYRLKKLIFKTKHKKQISVSRMGVISLDDEYKEDLNDIEILVDFINIGPRILE